jgi:hypothetical protein
MPLTGRGLSMRMDVVDSKRTKMVGWTRMLDEDER